MKKRVIFTISTLIFTTMILTSCGTNTANKKNTSSLISISGSTSVGPLVEKEAEVYSSNNNINIDVNQTGSSSGINDTMTGVVEIGMSSRDLEGDEATTLEKVEIALDGIAVIVNNKNSVKNLTIQQVKDIFTGKVSNWSQVGGPDWPIVVVSRESGSGTREVFEEKIGYKESELVKQALIVNATGGIKVNVEINKNAIGYMSIGYLDDMISAITIDNVEPTGENVKLKKYKIQRPFLLVYKKDTITDNGKGFVDFILSEEGQKIVEEDRFIRIK